MKSLPAFFWISAESHRTAEKIPIGNAVVENKPPAKNYPPPMNRKLFLLALCQGLFLTNNVTFIAINGLVGLALAPLGWLATLPVTGYVVGGGAVAPRWWPRSQRRAGAQALVPDRAAGGGAVGRALRLGGGFAAVLAAGDGDLHRRLLQRECVAVPLCGAGTGGARLQGKGDLAGAGGRHRRRGGRAEPGECDARLAADAVRRRLSGPDRRGAAVAADHELHRLSAASGAGGGRGQRPAAARRSRASRYFSWRWRALRSVTP